MEVTSFRTFLNCPLTYVFFDDSKVATPFIKSSAARTLFLEKLGQTKWQTDRQIYGQTDRRTHRDFKIVDWKSRKVVGFLSQSVPVI
jgi:hypothetical protein